jgi:hypothetical protein
MDEEKKSEESGQHPERLGPYLIQEQVQQSDDSQVELYLATHETSGATALVRKHAAEESAARGKEWRVRLGCWASGGVLEEVRRMARVVADPHEPRLRWPLGLGVASAATVGALLCALVRLASVSQPPSTPPALMNHGVPTAPGTSDFDAWLADTTPPGQTALTRPLPKEPFKGQKRPPCTRYTEVELVGACWMQHALTAPCPETIFEYQGKCYVPAFSAKPPPSSLGQ